MIMPVRRAGSLVRPRRELSGRTAQAWAGERERYGRHAADQWRRAKSPFRCSTAAAAPTILVGPTSQPVSKRLRATATVVPPSSRRPIRGN